MSQGQRSEGKLSSEAWGVGREAVRRKKSSRTKRKRQQRTKGTSLAVPRYLNAL